MLVPKIYKTVYLTDILAFLKHCYGNTFDETKLIESMDGKRYIEYTKDMFKDSDIEIYYDIREMREEGILPKEFIVINNL